MTGTKSAANPLTGTASAVAFLSRLPAGKFVSLPEHPDLADAARYFPLAGIIIALPALIAALILHLAGSPALVTALVMIAVFAATTGALHEDGLADCADGFWGASERDKKLDIMRDSRIGTYGAMALILAIAIRAAAAAYLLETAELWLFLAVMAAIGMASRAAMVWVWANAPAARANGLSRDFGEPGPLEARHAMLLGVLPAMILLFLATGMFSALVIAGSATLAVLFWRTVCNSQIGGRTGDTLGATQQICEITLFIAATIAI